MSEAAQRWAGIDTGSRVARNRAVAVSALILCACGSADENDGATSDESRTGAGGTTNTVGSSAAGGNEGEDPLAGGTSSGGEGATSRGGATGSGGSATCDPSLTEANKTAAEDAMVRLLVETDETAFEEYWADPYLQHNPVAESGVDAFWSFFGPLVEAGDPIYSLTRLIGECDLVLAHGTYDSGVVFDMFRLENGKFVEHWDAGAVGPGPNASGHTALDGPTEPMNSELTEQNKQFVVSFTEDVLISGETSNAAMYLGETLVEHNAEGMDGREAFLQYRADNSITTAQIHHVIADGNFVFTMTEGALDGQPHGFYDLYRIEGELIVEHWEGRRAVPETTASGLPIF